MGGDTGEDNWRLWGGYSRGQLEVKVGGHSVPIPVRDCQRENEQYHQLFLFLIILQMELTMRGEASSIF